MSNGNIGTKSDKRAHLIEWNVLDFMRYFVEWLILSFRNSKFSKKIEWQIGNFNVKPQ